MASVEAATQASSPAEKRKIKILLLITAASILFLLIYSSLNQDRWPDQWSSAGDLIAKAESCERDAPHLAPTARTVINEVSIAARELALFRSQKTGQPEAELLDAFAIYVRIASRQYRQGNSPSWTMPDCLRLHQAFEEFKERTTALLRPRE